MISYELIVVLMAVGAMVAAGGGRRHIPDSFETIAAAIPGGASATTLTELTPDEKWEKAQADRDTAVEDAKARRDAATAEANAIRSAQIDANKALPKPERQASNKEANETRNAAPWTRPRPSIRRAWPRPTRREARPRPSTKLRRRSSPALANHGLASTVKP